MAQNQVARQPLQDRRAGDPSEDSLERADRKRQQPGVGDAQRTGVLTSTLGRRAESGREATVFAVGPGAVSSVLGLDMVAASVAENALECRPGNRRPERVPLPLHGEVDRSQGGSRSGM